jgi:fructokinase
MITAVGDDDLGKEITEIAGKRVKLVLQVNEYATGTVQVTLDAQKKPSFEITKDVAYDHIEFSEEVEGVEEGARFFCFGSLAQRSPESRETLKRILENTKAWKIYDFNHRKGLYNWEELFDESMKHADTLKLNDEEAAMVMESRGHTGSPQSCVKELMKEYDVKQVFVTMGDKGATLYAGDEVIHVDAPKVDVVDTTGCGDAFTAAIAYSMKNGFDNKKMLTYSVEVAAKVAKVKGAVPERLD